MTSRTRALTKLTYKRLIQYFVQGILILAPISLTGYLLYRLFDWVDGILRPYLNIPGLGFLIIIAFVLLVGWLSSNIFIGGFFSIVEHWLERAPAINFVYSMIKDFFEAFAGDKKKFDKAVLAQVFSDHVWIVGFLTDEEMKKFEFGEDYVAVYVPQAYNFAGQLYVLPREKVRKIEQLTSGESMKYAVTGGVVDIDEAKKQEL